MIAQEGQRAGDDGLLVAFVFELEDILRLVGVNLRALAHHGSVAVGIFAVIFRLERAEHPLQEVGGGNGIHLRLHADKLETHGYLVDLAVRQVHHQRLAVHDLLEPSLGSLCLGSHEHTHHHGAVVLRLHAEHRLGLVAELQAEVVQVHLVVHLLYAQGNHLELRSLYRVRRCYLELGGDEYLLLYLLCRSHSGVIGHLYGVAAYIGLNAVHARHLLHLGLEGHGAAIALDTLEAGDLERLELHAILDAPGLADGGKFVLAAHDECDSQ